MLMRKNQKSSEERVCICVDVDSFFAQCDSRKLGLDNSVPLVHVQWGLCVAVNYAARAKGIPNGAFLSDALKIYPEVFVSHANTIKPGDEISDPYAMDLGEKLKSHDKNTEKVSLEHCRMEADKIFSILENYCGIVEKASFDEAFMDVTLEAREIYQSGEFQEEWKGKMLGGEVFKPEDEQEILLMIGTQIAERIRIDVEATLKYTCSAGIAHNKMLCKLASGLNKPFGQAIFCPRYTIQALKPMGIQKLRNFGRKITEAFEEEGFTKLGEVHELNLQQIQKIMGDEKTARWVYFRARGYDDEEVKEKEFASKSISSRKILRNSMSMSEIMIPVELLLTELHVRLVKYFERSKMIPKTLNLHYFDDKEQKHRSKSTPLDLKRKTEDFKSLIFEKGMSLVNSVRENLFPTQYLTFSIKDFEKSDFDQFEYDLKTFFMNKESSQEKVNDLVISEENSRSTDVTKELEEEKICCEKCFILILKKEIKEHLDFHVAEELDRELNPNKKKYKNEVVRGGDCQKRVDMREQNLELKKVKKTPTPIKLKNIQTLDNFFCKK